MRKNSYIINQVDNEKVAANTANSNHPPEVQFDEIERLISQAKTSKYGFEDELLEYILCRFIQYGEDHNCCVLHLFRKLFIDFKVAEYFEGEGSVHLLCNVFEYINVSNDLFLPSFTAENFVVEAIKSYFKEKRNAQATVKLRFLIN